MSPPLTLTRIVEMLQSGEASSRELTDRFLARIEAVESKIGAFIAVDAEGARAQADAADATRRQTQDGDTPPLLGVPLGLKDILCVKGQPTTCASRILREFRPPYDATAVSRLREAGAVFLGKLNMDEFAMGSSTENSAFGRTANPWDLERIPGGSSGGSAAAVAAGECPAALGTDTGGSIRQPAALCGVVGVKPTYGRVSRYGLIAYGSSLDQIGPLTRTVADAALLLNAICGHDPRDSTSAPVDVPDFTAEPGRDVRGLRVGLPREYFVEGLDPEVEAAVRAAVEQLAELGAKVVEIDLPHTEYAVAAYYLVATAEASSNLARYDGAHYGHRAESAENIIDMFTRTRTEGFGPEVKRRIMLGTYALSEGFYDAYYLKALKTRALIRRDFDAAFERVDVIATPTSPTPAFRFGEKTDDPLQMYLADIFTISCNLAGLPGLSLPCGFTAGGLPIGLQLIAPAFDEATMLRAAAAYEQTQEWSQRTPEV